MWVILYSALREAKILLTATLKRVSWDRLSGFLRISEKKKLTGQYHGTAASPCPRFTSHCDKGRDTVPSASASPISVSRYVQTAVQAVGGCGDNTYRSRQPQRVWPPSEVNRKKRQLGKLLSLPSPSRLSLQSTLHQFSFLVIDTFLLPFSSSFLSTHKINIHILKLFPTRYTHC